MADFPDCPRGKVPLWPPNGGQEPTFFLERYVSQQLNWGWTLEPKRPSRVTRLTRQTTTTDKPKQTEQGAEDTE